MVDMGVGSKRGDYQKTANGKTRLKTSSMCDVKGLASKSDSCTEIFDWEMDSSVTEVIDVNIVSGGKYTEKVNGEMGSSGSRSLKVKIVSKGEDCVNTANDVLHSGNIEGIDGNGESLRKRKKKKKNKKLSASVILTPNDVHTETANSGRKDARSSEQSLVFGELMEIDTASSLSEKLTIGNGEILNDQNHSASTLKDFSNNHRLQPVRIHVTTSRKMLLILDVNGLLADIIHPPPKDRKSDINISRRAMFKRPFLDDFLGFCFERFDVAIWSSRARKILVPLVDYLLGDLKNRLVFLWDLSHCTNSRARCRENYHKFIVFKELRKIWEENSHIAPENRYYDKSNTLLLDDSPYKALLNPKHTGIFPLSYSYKDVNDNSLGPDGDLRVYLEGVAATENVQMYVQQHPFGQQAIDETSPYWAEVLKGVS